MSTLPTIDGFIPNYPYPDAQQYASIFGTIVPWANDDWRTSCNSWKETVSLHSGLSWEGAALHVTGPGAQDYLSHLSTNNVYKWRVNHSKHLVMCNEDGLIRNHCLAQRDGEQAFTLFSCENIIDPKWGVDDYDVSFEYETIFIFQISGPQSLTLLEKVTQQDCHDLKFLDVRNITIEGYDKPFQIARIGMTNGLAYELRGPKEYSVEMYDKVFQAGKPFGIKRLGYRNYLVNHTEGGFPQVGCHFSSADILDEMGDDRFAAESIFPLLGSISADDVHARLRNPFEVGWGFCVKFDHDFIGRAALEEMAASPKRSICNLMWSVEDFLDIQRSQLEEGEEYKFFEFPLGINMPAGGEANYVLKDGKVVGIASVPVYSYTYRCIIAQCVIDVDQNIIGNEVVMQWGDYGKRIKDVRCTVERYPFLLAPENRTLTVDDIPSGVGM